MSLRAIAGIMVFLATGIASSTQCLARLHDLCRLSIPGLHCMADSCWGIESMEALKTSLRQDSSPELMPGDKSSNYPCAEIDTFPSADLCELPTMSVQWLNHTEFSLIESRGSWDFESYSSSLLLGWHWFIQDLSGRLTMRRFVAEAAGTASDWLSQSSSLLSGLVGRGFDLLAQVDSVASNDAIAHAPSEEKSDCSVEPSAIDTPLHWDAFVPPAFAIYQLRGKDFLVPRNLIQNWSIVPDFGDDDHHEQSIELAQDEVFNQDQGPDKGNEQLNRAFQLTLASQLETAAEKLLMLARSLKEQAATAVELPSQVAEGSSVELRK